MSHVMKGVLVNIVHKHLSILWVLLLSQIPLTAAAVEISPSAQQSAPFATSDARPRTVTLITGDQVIVASDLQHVLSIRAGTGRSDIHFSTHRYRSTDGKAEHLEVIPSDAMPLIAAGKLDSELFDITALMQAGYDDASRDDIPLIMTYTQRTTQRLSASSLSAVGAAVSTQLRTVNGVAVHVSKAQAQQLWESLTAGAPGARNAARAVAVPGLGESVAKVWLDRVFQPTLDRSVPQIGAPIAWAAGFTGRGVLVAVIDSGVDATHPDLADRVVDKRNFTDEVDEDIVGHGTHVASIIAGSGAASSGRYRGVAPDAQLIAGKVCFVFGCPLSTILAGLDWAVLEKHAQVVNLSLGGPDTPDIDPIEDAINRLSAEHGTLFVVAAGNTGTSPVSSPGSADAALTVGAIDRDESIAPFSSRGPRLVDNAIKPDVTAPGVQIVAARAADTELGPPVGDSYVRVSGTSMATPHVAGAAAILLQRHPDWTGLQIKAALMGSAKRNPSVTAYDEGAGRVDVAAAIDAVTLASPASASLGIALWPHEDDELITRAVTYRNLGTESITLEFRAEITGPGGNAPPAGMFAISPAALTLPAGGAGTVTVTANTRLSAPDGLYSGRIVGLDRARGRSHTLPIAVQREVESYEVVLHHTDRGGADALLYFTNLIGLDTFSVRRVFGIPGDVTVRLPRGRYALGSQIFTFPEFSVSVLVKPVLDVTAPQRVAFDARTAQPIAVTAPAATLPISGEIDWGATTTWGGFAVGLSSSSLDGFFTAQLGSPLKGFQSLVSGIWTGTQTGKDGTSTPARYAAGWTQNDAFPTGLTETVRPERMAIVHASYAAARPTLGGAAVGAGAVAGILRATIPLIFVQLPYQQTEYYTVGQDLGWRNALLSITPDFRLQSELLSAVTHYPFPLHFLSRWNQAPYAPPNDVTYRTAARLGDTLSLLIPLLGDRFGHTGFVAGQSHLALFRNGTKLSEVDSDSGQFTLPPDPGTYRLEASLTQQILELSSQVNIAWTFRSAHVSGATPVALPLLTAEFKPPLNQNGEATAGSVIRMPIVIQQDARPGPVRVKSVEVEVSFDEGARWSRVPVRLQHGDWSAFITHPSKGQYVSLRTSISDFSGNTAEQTVIRAYSLRTPAQ